MRRLLLSFILCMPLFLGAASPEERYPSYRYVFSEFDVENSYIYNDTFVSFVQQKEKALKRFYNRVSKQGAWIAPMLRGELLEEGLSDLFFYLSVVESGLSLDAVSSKKAVGLWQFMPDTARHYHLDVGNFSDERCDPFVATRAAVSHLKRLHRKFGKWYLAVMAYNCGEGRMQQAIKRAGTDALEILTDEDKKYLPKETRDYIHKILLVAMIGESETIASLFTSEKEHTPFVKHTEKGESQSRTVDTPLDCLLSHVVITGETLEVIASEYDSSVNAIKKINALQSDILESGRLLLIPVSRKRFDDVTSQS